VTEKTRFDLVPMGAVAQIADVLAHGAAKYQAHNWARGTEWSRYYAAALRHLAAWSQGEDLDPDSGLSHLAHAGCCIVFLLEYQRHDWGSDDRFRGPDGAAFTKDDGRSHQIELPQLDWDQVGHLPGGNAPVVKRCCWVDPAGESHCEDKPAGAINDDDDGLS
jgi:hypothetical protein